MRYKITFESEEPACKKAKFNPLSYESGVIYTHAFREMIKNASGEESIMPVVFETLSLIRLRVENLGGICYRQIVNYKDVTFYVVDDDMARAITFMTPEDYA